MIEVVRARAEQAPVVAQLLELYAYDFSFFRPFDVKDDGRYGYEELPLYWSEPARIPYLIWVNEKLAGFSLIHQLDVWDMAEFFILPRFRKQGAGLAAVEQLWRRHPGPWQVRILEANTGAHEFWDKAIARAVGNPVAPLKTEKKGVPWRVYHFDAR